jgi:hypothetical protein
MVDDYRIPAASIGDVDLGVVAQRFPGEAREIRRLEDLMHRGEETREEFWHLCELLHRVGATEDAEYLLRRNIACAQGRERYRTLFGTAVPDAYERAIECFAREFGLELTPDQERDFLDHEYRSTPGAVAPRFNILNHPCVIRFTFSHRDFVVADVVDAAANEAEKVNYFDLNTNVFFRWQHERWRLIDPRDAWR